MATMKRKEFLNMDELHKAVAGRRGVVYAGFNVLTHHVDLYWEGVHDPNISTGFLGFDLNCCRNAKELLQDLESGEFQKRAVADIGTAVDDSEWQR